MIGLDLRASAKFTFWTKSKISDTIVKFTNVEKITLLYNFVSFGKNV